MSNRDYLEQYAWKIIGAYDMESIQPLAQRIDVDGWIEYFREEREALYKQLNGIKPTLANYWSLPTAEQRMVRQDGGMK